MSKTANETVTGESRQEALRAARVQLYPERFVADYPNLADVPPEEGEILSLAGRVLSIRNLGKLSFATIADITGQIQIAVDVAVAGQEVLEFFRQRVRAGDFVGVSGRTFRTRTEEFTVGVTELQLLSPALRPLPEKWHGLRDQELRYRQRYLDIIGNRSSRRVFQARSRFVSGIRRFLEAHGFFEVDTPVLELRKGGALAKPFSTRHNHLGLDAYLRIAPETWLKRATASGFNRCFEFARCFRNEGASADHLQEFTMLEFYAAYWNYEDNMDFSRRLLQAALMEAFGTLEVERADGAAAVDFSGDWPVVNFREIILEGCGVDIAEHESLDGLRTAALAQSVELHADDWARNNRGRFIDALYKRVARPKLQRPCFLIGHPIETSPLARANDADPSIADRFQVVVCGVELMNGYSELVDPVEQRKRLEAQAAFQASGDDEAMDLDEDYLLCMEHGMPPISGCGLGIDRALKIALGLGNIRDAVLFPLMRPANGEAGTNGE